MSGLGNTWESQAKDQLQGTLEWTGAIDGDWSDIGNWNSLGFTGVQAGAGNTRLFTSGAVDVDAGKSQSGVVIDGLFVGEGYTGDIGSALGFLTISVVETSIRKRKGAVFLGGTLSNVYINGTAATDPSVFLGGTIGTVVILDAVGQVEFHAGTTVDNLICCPIGRKFVRVKINTFCTVANFRAYGTTEIESASGTSTELVVAGDSVGTFTDGTHAAVTVQDGGLVNYEAADDISGTVTVAGGGLFRTQRNLDTALTIGGVALYRNGTADLRSRTRNVTVTNPANAWGGRLLLDHGQTASV